MLARKFSKLAKVTGNQELLVWLVREVFKKSKWKFKMAFAMKGGGSRPVSSATYLF